MGNSNSYGRVPCNMKEVTKSGLFMFRKLGFIGLLGGLGLLSGCAPKSVSPPLQNPAPAATGAGMIVPNPKISSRIVAMSRRVRATPGGSARAGLSTFFVHVNAAGQIQVYIRVKALAPALQARLRTAGASGIRPSVALGLYQAWATPEAIQRIAALPEVTRITPPVYGITK